MENIELKLKELAGQFEKIQTDLNNAIRSKTLLDSQLQENKAVEKEFTLLKEENAIYKLVGPILVKQEKIEAVTNVEKRIEYIQTEIKRLETQIKELESKSDVKRNEIVKMQNIAQDAMNAAANASA